MSEMRQITTTSSAGLQALGTAGQRSWELVSRTVARAPLGPAHAALFAEPVMPESGDQTDWYTSLDGRMRPLAALDAADREVAEARMAELMEDIRGLSGTLRASEDADTQRLGEALEYALCIPGERSVWVVENGDKYHPFQPVMVDWASVDDSHAETTDRALTGWAPRRPAPVIPAQPPGDGGQGVLPDGSFHPVEPARLLGGPWLLIGLWLLLAILTAAVLRLLLPACGLAGFNWWNTCPVPVAITVLDEEDLRRGRGVIENRIAFLEREIALTDEACVALPREPAPADEIDDRLDREDAQRGENEIALVWNSLADIDLHVQCPAGDVISFRQKNSSICSGRLDVDMNVSTDQHSMEPVEHVYFTSPAPGRYRIEVVLFNAGAFPGPHDFRVRVSFGSDVQEFTGQVSAARPRWSTTYTLSP